MGVFKEEVYMLEQLAKQQKQIYGDACDYGILATTSNKNIVKHCLQTLPNMSKPVWKVERPIRQYKYKTKIDWDDDNSTAIEVLYVDDKPHKKEYFCISFR